MRGRLGNCCSYVCANVISDFGADPCAIVIADLCTNYVSERGSITVAVT